MKYLAVLPARSGSKRVKNKNIKLVAGKPLMYYQINIAKNVEDISKVIVATDEKYYADMARSFGADVIMRPKNISDGDSKTEETLLFVISELEKKNEFFDNVVLLQITSPLNQEEYVIEGIKLMETGKYRSVLTYTDFNGFLLSDKDIFERPMSQKRTPKKMETGCFWITNIKELKKTKNRLIEPYGCVKVSKTDALEIDTPDELFIIEKILEKRTNICEKKYFKTHKLRIKSDENHFELNKDEHKIIDICKNEVDFINSLYTYGSKRKFLDLGYKYSYIPSKIDSNKYVKYGLYPSKNNINTANEYLDHVVSGSLEDETFEQDFFDIIFCNHVLERIEDPIVFVKNIREILKTHGHLIICSINFDSCSSRLFEDKYEALYDKKYVNLFSDFSLKELLEDHGFIVDNIDYPFFNIDFFTKENLLSLFDKDKTSLPFYGNFMTLYARKK